MAVEVLCCYHDHALEIKNHDKPYTCDGCKTESWGLRLRCEACNFDLHEECAFTIHEETTCHDFFPGLEFRFFRTPPREYYNMKSGKCGAAASCEKCQRYCDGCGKAVDGFVYHCEERGLDLHPPCLKLNQTLAVADVEFRLRKETKGKCIRCRKTKLADTFPNIRGWSYVSTCGEYHLHVHCRLLLIIQKIISWGLSHVVLDILDDPEVHGQSNYQGFKDDPSDLTNTTVDSLIPLLDPLINPNRCSSSGEDEIDTTSGVTNSSAVEHEIDTTSGVTNSSAVVEDISDGHDHDHDQCQSNYQGSKLEWIFTLTNLSLEILSAYLDQMSSQSRPQYAMIAMIVSLVALLICMVEFGYKATRLNGFDYRSLTCRPTLESFVDNFGLLCTLLQCITSAVQYAYFKRHEDCPVKLSLFPLLFVVYVIISKLRR